jgi:phosphoenolpyruvate carboxylase
MSSDFDRAFADIHGRQAKDQTIKTHVRNASAESSFTAHGTMIDNSKPSVVANRQRLQSLVASQWTQTERHSNANGL